MLTRDELRQRVRRILEGEQLDEANTNDLPAMLILKRGTVRVLTGGERVAQYYHDSGFTIIYPMMFSKGGKK